MFTGIVDAVGEVVSFEPFEEGARFTVDAAGLSVRPQTGASVAVDGVCQTVTRAAGDRLVFEAVRTTLSRTTIGELAPGRQVNLETPVRAGEPLGGHHVQGHVDGVAETVAVERAGETVLVRLRLPAEVARLTVRHGSLAVDGVSLTVNDLVDDIAEVAIIPYTWTHTSLSRLEVGSRVNVEGDLVAKYVERLLHPYGEA